MPSPNASYDNLITTTLERRTGKVADNITNNLGFFNYLKKTGNMKMFSGGLKLNRELEYATNSTFKYLTAYEQFDITPQELFTTASFDIKTAGLSIVTSGQEIRRNSGKEAIINLAEAKIKNAEKTLTNQIGAGLYANGTGNDGKEIGGLQYLLPDDPTSGTVGGINRANYTFWRNQVVDFSTDIGAVASETNIHKGLNKAILKSTRNAERPNLIILDANYYEFLLTYLQGIQQVVQTDKADVGFREIMFHGIKVVCDGQLGGACPENHGYVLNLDYIFFETHKDMNFAMIGGERNPTNQDAVIKLMGWEGNMTLSNAEVHTVLKN